jgi:hypothetical protein
MSGFNCILSDSGNGSDFIGQSLLIYVASSFNIDRSGRHHCEFMEKASIKSRETRLFDDIEGWF